MTAYITWGLWSRASNVWFREFPTREAAERWAADQRLYGFVAMPVSLLDLELEAA